LDGVRAAASGTPAVVRIAAPCSTMRSDSSAFSGVVTVNRVHARLRHHSSLGDALLETGRLQAQQAQPLLRRQVA
jgi:hypothetical protein